MPRLIASLLAVTFAVSCSSGEGGHTVKMVPGRRFEPRTVTVQVGDTVTWEVESGDPHSVTAYEDEIPEGADYFSSGGFSSESAARDALADALLDTGDTYSVTFETAGTYPYFCIPHEAGEMTGTVVVEP